MRKLLLLYYLLFFALSSCEKNIDEQTDFNSFLESNYEFNNRNLNQNRAYYYTRIEEIPEKKIDRLNNLDPKVEALISDIDKAIKNEKSSIENLISEYRIILDEIKQIVKFDKDYLITELNQRKKTKNYSNKFRLNIIKNELVIAMNYVFEYANTAKHYADGFRKLDSINTRITQIQNNSIKINLSSDIAQSIKENRHIIIDNIKLNGINEKIDYKIMENHSFADIELDSLKNGKYTLNGILRYYHRNGKIDIPFRETFEIK
ncbi:hypothetical protein DFQ10_1141 [Winogradskyella eximia]|uniref:GldM-like protein n=1 Tax=Winogradskyella eximia TaxID=262006 RepID=A0A3D9GPL1_9FLAO|nr:hypothetical protein [Winogradskyella eximia]RED37915.1 hypothetical protein DFQ10_1141 [Winogradskyella eximia]